jgi:deoxyribodipyrimidine photo-lyase
MTLFVPTRLAAFERMAAVDPDAYARTRNDLTGAVTGLSPYLTHGLLTLREVYDSINARHALGAQHKLVFELGWRAYYRHVWTHRGNGVHQSLHPGPLPDEAYRPAIPMDVQTACTGVPAIDLAVRTLYETGYLHNHARMWLASYLVHIRKVHWHAGAQWMLGYLLDGDVASNHLSWQWVAGTASVKPYLFNADNVAKYAPQPWHSFGTAIDTSYEALDTLSRRPDREDCTETIGEPGQHNIRPACTTAPTDQRWAAPDPKIAKGKDVWLIHPWSMGSTRVEPTDNTCTIAIGLAECHAPTPWSAQRWRFVTEGVAARTSYLWWSTAMQLADALHAARSVQWQPDPHMDAALLQMQERLLTTQAQTHVQAQAAAPLFENVTPLCASFAQWWRKTQLMP